jgi:hypothetical protein
MIKISETLLLLSNYSCYNVKKMKFRNAGYADMVFSVLGVIRSLNIMMTKSKLLRRFSPEIIERKEYIPHLYLREA